MVFFLIKYSCACVGVNKLSNTCLCSDFCLLIEATSFWRPVQCTVVQDGFICMLLFSGMLVAILCNKRQPNHGTQHFPSERYDVLRKMFQRNHNAKLTANNSYVQASHCQNCFGLLSTQTNIVGPKAVSIPRIYQRFISSCMQFRSVGAVPKRLYRATCESVSHSVDETRAQVS